MKRYGHEKQISSLCPWRTPQEEAPPLNTAIRHKARVGLKDRSVCEEGGRMSTEDDEAVALGEMNQGGEEEGTVSSGDGGVGVGEQAYEGMAAAAAATAQLHAKQQSFPATYACV